MGSSYLNTDICNFESTQKDERRSQSADSLKAYRKPRAFKKSVLFHFQSPLTKEQLNLSRKTSTKP